MMQVANELSKASRLAAQRAEEDALAAKAVAEKERDRATDFLAQKLELESEVLRLEEKTGEAMPMIDVSQVVNTSLPVISIGDGDHRVNKRTVSVMVRKHGAMAAWQSHTITLKDFQIRTSQIHR